MPNVEVIYIHRNKNSDSNNLEPSLDLHKTREITPPEKPVYTPKTSFKPKKQKKGLKFYVSIAVVFLLFITVFSTTFNAGYIPIDQFLEIKEPSGNSREISYMQVEEKYPIVDSIPEIRTVKHKLFGTDNTISNVADDYEKRLMRQGYKLEYCGSTDVKGINVHYYGFVKGITAVVVLMTSDDVGVANTETVVLYSTANVFTYKSLIDKYSNEFDF